ncbi:universal stress protein [Actinacidiphila sp. bgisy144]|uniref:universal stress protein n=1 Tax=Actinacidiphila sp. bgisy144 TaxID=3413791 RepID=UPI003EBAEBD7
MDSAEASGGLGPVVVGTDGSAPAGVAVLWAAEEAARRGRPLTVVSALGSDETRYVGPEGLQELLQDADRCLRHTVDLVTARYPDLAVDTVLSRGDPADSVLEAAGATGTAVVGSRGLGGFSGLLLGSVGLRAAARARGPLVVVHRVPEPERGVVVAAARDDGDRDALRFAARSALARGAALRVVSAWMFLEGVGSMVPMVDDVAAVAADEAGATRRTVRPLREEFPHLEITEQTVRTRSTGGALVTASEDADLLVLGARRPTHRFRAPFGGVTHAVLHHAQCPVAVIHGG